MADPREGWNNTDHNWCVAYWLHQGLLRYRRRVYDVEEADAVFIAPWSLILDALTRHLAARHAGGSLRIAVPWNQVVAPRSSPNQRPKMSQKAAVPKAPPACVGRLLAGVHEALPELARHYRVGWVQINDSSGADEIRGHVDRPGWGDVICTFTTARCALTLKPDAQVRGRAPKCAATFDVPANSLYVLSGASRAFATGCRAAECVSADLAGLGPSPLRALDRWMEMYETHDKYTFVGTLVEDPVDVALGSM